MTLVVQASLDAEAAVISAVLCAPEKYDEVQPVLGGNQVFYSDANRWIWRSVEALRESGTALDLVTVAQWLRDQQRLDGIGGTPYLAEIFYATPAVLHAEEHARIVREKWRLRQALAVAQTIVASVKAGTSDVENVQEFLEATEARFADLAHQDIRVLLRPLQEVLKVVFDQLVQNRARGSAITGTATGFSAIDQAMSGLQPGDLYVVAGRPGMGKTAFVLNIGRNIAASGEGVAMFSLEMPAEQLGLRLLSAETKINNTRLRTAVYLDAQDWGVITQGVADMDRLPFWVDDTPAISISAIRSRIRKLRADLLAGRAKNATNLAVVIIDYLQLLGSIGAVESREKEVAKFSRELKALAKEEKVAIIALSQLNRKSEGREDKRPQLHDLRETGAIEQDADAVLFLYRDEYYDEDTVDRGLCEVIIAKQRNGPTGTKRLRFQAEYGRFDNLAAEEFDDYDPGAPP